MQDEQRRAGFELGSGKFTVRAIRVKGLAARSAGRRSPTASSPTNWPAASA